MQDGGGFPSGDERGKMKERPKGRFTRVESYSGYKGHERPIAFFLGPRRMEVRRVLRRGRTPDSERFRVEAEDGYIYDLAWNREEDRWLVWEDVS